MLASTTAGAGHLGPVVPFARACVAAGHDVVMAAPASFAASVGAAGFEHVPFPDVAAEVMEPCSPSCPRCPGTRRKRS